MAGKHVFVGMTDFSVPGTAVNLARYRPIFPGTREDRAYAEGRARGKAGGVAGDNPNANVPANNTAYWGWVNGFLNSLTDSATTSIQTRNPPTV